MTRMKRLLTSVLVMAATLMLGTVSAQTVNITISVDMSNEVGTFTTVHCPGTHNGFDPTTALMSDPDGDNVYTITFAGNSGVEEKYKIVKDASYANEESVPAACGLSNGFGSFDRFYNSTTDLAVPEFCWSDCVPCAASVSVDVTFKVDAAELGGSDSITIAGDMNGFTPTLMDDSDGDGVWEITYNITAGALIKYKFLNGYSFANEEAVPGDCGVSNGFGGFDRLITVPGIDTCVGPVCFAQCDLCGTCNSVDPITGLSSSVDATSVTLSWNSLLNSEGCRVSGGPLGGPMGSKIIPVPGVGSLTLPTAILAPGIYSWGVQCACTTIPLVVTPPSATDNFVITAPRLGSETNFSLYPNPASTTLNLEVQANLAQRTQVELTDITGKLVQTTAVELTEGRNVLSIDISDLTDGVYFANIIGVTAFSTQFNVVR